MLAPAQAASAVFDRLLCGVDQSPAGELAARAAARVAAPAGSLVLVAVEDPSIVGFGMPGVREELARRTAEQLERVREEIAPLHPVETVVLEGSPIERLLAEAQRRDATLLVVGSHDFSRVGGIAFGSVATHLLHKAPCPLLVVRGAADDAGWPRRVTVGLDGSSQSAHALAVARSLAARLGSSLRVVTATRDARVDVAAARALAPELEEHDARALDALAIAGETADLVVVGSRGLRGLRALGSLSERLAHEADCSVLVVRPAPGGR